MEGVHAYGYLIKRSYGAAICMGRWGLEFSRFAWKDLILEQNNQGREEKIRENLSEPLGVGSWAEAIGEGRRREGWPENSVLLPDKNELQGSEHLVFSCPGPSNRGQEGKAASAVRGLLLAPSSDKILQRHACPGTKTTCICVDFQIGDACGSGR